MSSFDVINVSANVQIAFALVLITIFLAIIAFRLLEKGSTR